MERNRGGRSRSDLISLIDLRAIVKRLRGVFPVTQRPRGHRMARKSLTGALAMAGCPLRLVAGRLGLQLSRGGGDTRLMWHPPGPAHNQMCASPITAAGEYIDFIIKSRRADPGQERGFRGRAFGPCHSGLSVAPIVESIMYRTRSNLLHSHQFGQRAHYTPSQPSW